MEELEDLLSQAANSAVGRRKQHAAFAELVRRFQDMVYGCALGYLGDFHLAEDVAQEAFLIAYERLGELREPLAFPGWLYRITRSRCNRFMRRTTPSTGPLEEVEHVATSEPDPAELTELHEVQRQLRTAMSDLPEEQRLATSLYYIAGYKHKEIAVLMNIPIATCRKRVQLARKRLKERMLEMTEEHRPSKSKGFTDNVMKLINAADQGDTHVMESLLNKDPSLASAREPVPGHHGVTALHKAKDARTARLLLDHGADPNARDVGHDSTPLTWATSHNDRDPGVIDVLLAGGAEVPDIYVAARLGNLEKVREFLDRDPSLASAMCDFPNLWGGCTALHIAVLSRHGEIVRLLVTAGADLEKKRVIPSEGNQAYALTALEMAKGKTEILQLLKELGAKR